MNGHQLTLVTEAPWATRARDWIEHLAPGEEFTAESLRRAIGEPEEVNAIGAVVMRASKQHLIAYAGQDVRCGRRLARGRYLRRWKRADAEVTA
jgi:hypothetical protein